MQTKYPKILKSEWSAFVASNSGKLDNFSKRKTKPLTFKQVKIELKQYVRGLISLFQDHKESNLEMVQDKETTGSKKQDACI